MPYVIIDAVTMGDAFIPHVLEAGRKKESFEGNVGTFEHKGKKYPLQTYGEQYEKLVATRLYFHEGRDVGSYRLIYESPQRSFVAYTVELDGDRNPVNMQRKNYDITSRKVYDEYVALEKSGPKMLEHSYIYGGEVESTVKIYEAVEGARLQAYAPPGTKVQAHLHLVVMSSGRAIQYTHTKTVGKNGQVEIRVPYSTRVPHGAVKPHGMWSIYKLTPDGRPVLPKKQFHVDDTHVTKGAQLRLGVLN